MNIVLRDFFYAKYRSVQIRFDRPFAIDERRDPEKPCGMFADLAGHCLGLFGAGGKLCLLVDGRALDIDPVKVRVAWYQLGGTRSLEIVDIRPNGIEFRVEYVVTSEPTVTMWWADTEEDVDFGLWLANVINTDERRCKLTESYQNGDQF